MKTSNTHLLIIDPQNSFCDIPVEAQPANPMLLGERVAPTLPVAGGHVNMMNLGAFLSRRRDKISQIHVTLDSHNSFDIAHACAWRNAKGFSPADFTTITTDDVDKDVWFAVDPALRDYFRKYVHALKAGNRYDLTIWPEHCIVGSWGHSIHAAVNESLSTWSRQRQKAVNYVFKGMNPLTEHYSAIKAEVPVEGDASTMRNDALLSRLADADLILCAGLALSHCVAGTLRDIADSLGPDNVHKLVLFTDCTSSVGGFESMGEQFINEMTARGMKTALSTDYVL